MCVVVPQNSMGDYSEIESDHLLSPFYEFGFMVVLELCVGDGRPDMPSHSVVSYH